jgi:hypothetical protein
MQYRNLNNEPCPYYMMSNCRSYSNRLCNSYHPTICNDYLKSKCDNLDCEYYHPKPCKFGKTCLKSGCKYYHSKEDKNLYLPKSILCLIVIDKDRRGDDIFLKFYTKDGIKFMNLEEKEKIYDISSLYKYNKTPYRGGKIIDVIKLVESYKNLYFLFKLLKCGFPLPKLEDDKFNHKILLPELSELILKIIINIYLKQKLKPIKIVKY